MSQKNKAKHEQWKAERRYGKPTRLADMIPNLSFTYFGMYDDTLMSDIIDAVSRSEVISADNVFDYVGGLSHEDMEWPDLPPLRLPFPLLFIEGRPVRRLWDFRIGALFEEIDPKSCFDSIARMFGGLCENRSRIIGELPWLRSECRYVVNFTMFHGTKGLTEPFGKAFLFLDELGKPLRSPFVLADTEPIPAYMREKGFDLGGTFKAFLYPLLLTIGFMNCKGVTLATVEPDARINQERRKAKLKPFIRYRTVNISPMKAVLRSEGNIETEGLKRALHRCRGHFATYTDSFLGRKLDKPVTVWRPAHVRGSAKAGVVFKDYRVNPPKPAGDSTRP